jgi:hypothetical protein
MTAPNVLPLVNREKVPELIKKNKRKRLIRTEAWKGQAKMFFLSRGHEILSRSYEILRRGHEIAKSLLRDSKVVAKRY